MTTDVSAQIQVWRQKSRDGTLTQDELRQAIIAIRESRGAAGETSAKSRSAAATTRAKKVPVSGDDLLSELGGL